MRMRWKPRGSLRLSAVGGPTGTLPGSPRELARRAAMVWTGLRATGFLTHPRHLAALVRASRRDGPLLACLIGAGARSRPDRTALVDDDGSITYSALNAAVDQTHELLRRSLPDLKGRPARIGVLCGDHRGFVIAVAAALRLGADPVLIGPRSGAVELAGLLERERIAAVVHDADGACGLAAAGRGKARAVISDGTGTVARAGALGVWWIGVAGGPRRPRRRPRVVLLTSGTTGAPVAAGEGASTSYLLPWLGLLGAVGVCPGKPVMVVPPLYHGHGFGFLAGGLLVGAPVVTAGGRTGEQIAATMARHDVAVMTGVPVHLQRLADHLDAAAPVAFPHLCRVVSGSARLRPDLVAVLTRHLGPVVVDLYGSTQTGTVTVATPVDLAAAPGTVGRSVPGVKVLIVDDEGAPVASGVEGRIVVHVGGAVVPSGDRGRIDAAGRLWLTGRTDGVVIIGGENVSPGEVEAFLAAQPGVAEVVVATEPDEVYGARLVADVVVGDGPLSAVDAPDVLRAAVRAGLASHKVPHRIRIVDALERSPIGKARVGGDGGAAPDSEVT